MPPGVWPDVATAFVTKSAKSKESTKDDDGEGMVTAGAMEKVVAAVTGSWFRRLTRIDQLDDLDTIVPRATILELSLCSAEYILQIVSITEYWVS